MPVMPPLPDDEKVKWKGSQVEFVAFIEIFEARGTFQLNNRNASADELAGLFLNIIDVDLSPFPDFRSMRIALEADSKPEQLLQIVIDVVEKEEQLNQALEGTGVLPSKEEQIKQITNWAFVHDFFEKLSKYVQWR